MTDDDQALTGMHGLYRGQHAEELVGLHHDRRICRQIDRVDLVVSILAGPYKKRRNRGRRRCDQAAAFPAIGLEQAVDTADFP